MNTQLNQTMESVSDNRFLNPYIQFSSVDTFTDKPGAANDKQYKISATRSYNVSEILRETIKVTRTSLKDLCQKHGLHLAEIEMALRGGRISREMAQKLENAFGSPVQFWV